MKEYFYKQFQKARSHFKGLQSKAAVRVWNLAKRLDLSRSKHRHEKRKPKGGK